MRRALLVGGVILGLAMAAAPLGAAVSIVGKPAADFALRGLDGRNLRLSEFRGQVVLVNFWARSDGDSRQQMPALDRINIAYQRAGLVVLGVSVDEDLRRARDFAAAMSVSYPILFDTGTEIGKDYFLQKMPMTILVDRSGMMRYSAVGFRRGDERVYLDQIRQLLRE